MRAVFLIPALAMLAACENGESMMMGTDAASGIEKSSAAFESAFNSGNAAGVAAMYLPDAIVQPPASPRVAGREAIRDLWQSYVDADLDSIDLMTVSVDDQGGTATELGRFSVDAPDGKGGRATVTGNYIVLWKRDADGVWRLKWDIWNDDPTG